MDLRERIVRAAEADTPRRVVARAFGVGLATVERYLRRARAGALAPRTSPGRPARIGPAAWPALRAQLAAAPDATLAKYVERWATAGGVWMSAATMHLAIARLDWTRKKRPAAPASRTR
jgi:transposase